MCDLTGLKNEASLNPLISIIIPSYNSMTGTKNIDKTLESLMNQTYHKIEILIVDNFSNDATYDICRNYPARFFRFRGNRSEARNYGISKMRGDYALFVDSDHVLMPRVVEECVQVSLYSKADCVIVPVTFISKTETRVNCSQMRNLEFRLKLGTQTLILFYSRDCIANISFPESVELGEDMIFSSKVLQNDPVVGRIKSCIYHFEDGTAKNLVSRSWSYGKKFRSTVSEIGPENSTKFVLSISTFNVTKMKKFAYIAPNFSTLVCFSFYTIVKHFSFGMSYLLSFLS